MARGTSLKCIPNDFKDQIFNTNYYDLAGAGGYKHWLQAVLELEIGGFENVLQCLSGYKHWLKLQFKFWLEINLHLVLRLEISSLAWKDLVIVPKLQILSWSIYSK